MRVLIVDDHPLFVDGMRTLLLGLDPDIESVAVGSVHQALELRDGADEGPGFDLVLLDMNLPAMSRLDALRTIKASFLESAVVVVSGEEDVDLIHDAMANGAAGYIPKTTDGNLTVEALRVVLAHGVYLPASALRHARVNGGRRGLTARMSPRQSLVFDLLLQGKSNKVIARELDMAEGTVKAHLSAVYQLLGVNTRTAAMRCMYEQAPGNRSDAS